VSFTWAYLDDGGAEVGRSEAFQGREAAEEWMGRAWEDLLERGIEEVALEDDERRTRVYRMGLREA
jgi:hypothetical protein